VTCKQLWADPPPTPPMALLMFDSSTCNTRSTPPTIKPRLIKLKGWLCIIIIIYLLLGSNCVTGWRKHTLARFVGVVYPIRAVRRHWRGYWWVILWTEKVIWRSGTCNNRLLMSPSASVTRTVNHDNKYARAENCARKIEMKQSLEKKWYNLSWLV